MPVSLAMLLCAGVMIACGVYLLLERTLTRVLLGFILAGNGVNLLFLVAAGKPGLAPFEGTGDPSEMSDPLPFAMVLTAIVITLGVAAFVVALAYRAWQLFGHDEVPDDVEDRRVLRRSRSARRSHAREAVLRGAASAHPEGPDDHPEDIPAEAAETLAEEYRPGVSVLTEDQRAGALREAQTGPGGASALNLDREDLREAREQEAAARGADTQNQESEIQQQAAADDQGDPLGEDLSSARDVPMDHTESDEDETDSASGGGRR